MDIIRWAIERPVTITVGVILVVVFGLIGLTAIPIQLTPTVDRPVITVTTSWPGRSPEEIVDTITKEQEKRLKNVTNLRTMRSVSGEGSASITLEFYVGTSIARALQEVSDQLRQVPAYPSDVDEPVMKAAEGAAENAIAWMIIDLDPARAGAHPGFDISTLHDAIDREVRPFLERIDGVAEVNVYGGRPREVRVLLDPTALAQRGLSHVEVVGALRAENRNISAGTIAEGKRDYRVRVIGQFASAREILDTVIAYRDGKPVYVGDVGTVEIGYDKARGFVRSMGVPCLAMNMLRQGGANVMAVMEEVRIRLDQVRTDILPRLDADAGPDLRLRLVYDETTYIRSSIDLVISNLREGGLICVVVLLVFLRSLKSTLVIALAIPVCVIGTFLAMLAAGRTLNVVSLAGLAFSTGVVVDNAIVVLENIDRRRTLGDPPLRAVYNGAREVWGAILAGTLCHVAVFIPILTVREEAGRLFFDLTLALSISILLSLLVAITVVPAAEGVLTRLTTRSEGAPPGRAGRWRGLLGLAGFSAGLTARFAAGLHWLMTGWRAWTLRPGAIALMVAASIVASRRLAPPLDYLPPGNQNLVFGGLLIPPGLSIAQRESYAALIESRLGPYLNARLDDPASLVGLPPIPRFDGSGKLFDPVPIEQMFVGAFGSQMFVGGTSQDPERVLPIANLITINMNGLPDAFGGAGQASIFGRGVAGGNNINIEISGPDLARVRAAAGFIFGAIMGAPGYEPGAVSSVPTNFNLQQQEWRVRLSRAGRELGLRTEDLGVAARGLFDGAFAGDYQLDGRTTDIKVYPTGGRLEFKERLGDVPVATPAGRIVPLSMIVDIQPATAPQEIQRIEELPSVTVSVRPPKGRPLAATMDDIRQNVIARAEAAGVIDRTMRVRLEGSAAKLDQVKAALLGTAPPPGQPMAGWRRALLVASWAIGVLGALAGAHALVRASRRREGRLVHGAIGLLLLGLIVGGVLAGVAIRPDLVLARFVWTLLVTYLLMCALFESFLYPFVIMFTVPLGLVGAFAALRLVHDWTLAHPTKAPQQLDVLTMLGFVILIGTVVNNAILLVEQARHFMGELTLPGEEGREPLDPIRAIAESVRTRVRPIFMTTCTTVGGGLPLVIAPGAGSEMYRGLGAVVLGGLLVSTIFTLVLVPLVFSAVLEMKQGVRALFRAGAPAPARRAGSHPVPLGTHRPAGMPAPTGSAPAAVPAP